MRANNSEATTINQEADIGLVGPGTCRDGARGTSVTACSTRSATFFHPPTPKGTDHTSASGATPACSRFPLDPSDPLDSLRMSGRVHPLYEHVQLAIVDTEARVAANHATRSKRTTTDPRVGAPGVIALQPPRGILPGIGCRRRIDAAGPCQNRSSVGKASLPAMQFQSRQARPKSPVHSERRPWPSSSRARSTCPQPCLASA